MEELPTIGLKICCNCNECTRCGDKNYRLSKRERRELQMIRENMVLDKKERRLHFRYPLIKDPSVLTDNRRQAVSMAEGLKRRLRKNGDLRYT